MIQSIYFYSLHSSQWAVVTAESMAWENKGTRTTRLYMEKDETKWSSDVKDTVVNLVDAVDPLTCGALASGSMSWHDDQRLSFLLLAAVVRERLMVRVV